MLEDTRHQATVGFLGSAVGILGEFFQPGPVSNGDHGAIGSNKTVTLQHVKGRRHARAANRQHESDNSWVRASSCPETLSWHMSSQRASLWLTSWIALEMAV